jgi:SAM-dependent methyltransferase
MMHSTIDLASIAPRLRVGADGIWQAPRAAAIDYPDEANAFCFGVEEHSFWFQHRNRLIVELVRRFPPAGPIADVGAGNGFVSLGLQRAGFPTIVIEPGPTGAVNARSRQLDPVVCATIQEAAFAARSLAAAGMFDVLEHIEREDEFVDGLGALLPPGGRLYVSVPAFYWLWSSEDDLVGHHRRYTLARLRRVLEGHRFTVDYATYCFSPLPAPLFLLRTLPSLLKLRTTLDARQTASELQPSPAAVNIVTRLLSYEVTCIRRGWRIPFGTSCLVAAHLALRWRRFTRVLHGVPKEVRTRRSRPFLTWFLHGGFLDVRVRRW